MKILFITSAMGFGGAERVISVISSELAARGHEVGIYATKASRECVYPLHEAVEIFSEDKIGSMSDVIKNIRRFVYKYDPDIVVPFMTYQCIYTCFALAFSKYPVVVCERNDPKNIDGKNTSRLRVMIRDAAFNMAEGAVFQTNGAKECFGRGIQKKSTVILNPINSAALVDPHEGVREKRIVNVGRLTEQKNQAMLIDAFSRIKDEFPEYTLEIYGDGELMDKLKAQASSLGVEDRVVFCGNVSNVGERIRGAEIFAFTSDYEGMPNALAEAMALGLACVSADCSPGGARMLIEDGVNGLITPCGDAEAFADALRRVLSDRVLAQRLGERAYGVRETLRIDHIVTRWENFFGDIISKKK